MNSESQIKLIENLASEQFKVSFKQFYDNLKMLKLVDNHNSIGKIIVVDD